MRIAVIGTGGVGGYFGAKLALAGHDVTFVARGAHLDAIRRDGLRIDREASPIHVRDANATAEIASIGPVDVAMFCVKLWDAEDVAPQLAPLVAGGGIAIPFQNGIDAPAILTRALGREHVAGGIAYISATIAAPGVVKVVGPMARLRVGPFEGIAEDRVRAFADALRGAGIDAEVVPDIRRALWEKFVMFCALSGATAVARQPIGVVRDNPELRAMFEAIMREALEMRASMAHDLAAGRRLEAPWLCGAVVRLGRERGVPTPVNQTIYAALLPYANGAAA